jgi:hypothetical protein
LAALSQTFYSSFIDGNGVFSVRLVVMLHTLILGSALLAAAAAGGLHYPMVVF